MKVLKKIIALLICTCMLGTGLVCTVFANDYASGFEGFALTEGSVDKSGILTLNGANASAAKTIVLPAKFKVSFSVCVEQYGTARGIVIGTNSYRAYVNMYENYFNIANGSRFDFPLGTDWHDFVFEVRGNKADVYVDDEFLGTSSIPTVPTGHQNITRFYATGGKVNFADFTVGELIEESKDGVKLEPTPAFQDDFEKQGWTIYGSEDVKYVISEDTGTDIYVSSKINGTFGGAYKTVVPSESYDFEYRMKLDKGCLDMSPGVRFDNGVSRFLACFYPGRYDDTGSLSIKTNMSAGNVRVQVENISQWHTYRVSVDGLNAKFFVDGECVADYTLDPTRGGAPNIEFFNEASSKDYIAFTVDKVKYTPFAYNTKILPFDGSKFLEKSNINFSAQYEGTCEAPRKIDYIANGMLIGSGEAPDYKFVWENVKCGNYEVYAVSENKALSRSIDISVAKRFGGKLVIPEKSDCNSNIKISTDVFHTAKDAYVEKVSYKILGKVYTQTNRTQNFQIDLGKLAMGEYKIQAVLTDNRGFTAETEGVLKVSSADTKGIIPGIEYQLDFIASDDGYIKTSDGNFELDLRFDRQGMTYKTATGYKILPLTKGSYGVEVRSGNVEITRNGHFEVSFDMPLANDSIPVEYSGLSDVSINPVKTSLIVAQTEGNADLKLKNMSNKWSLEFEKENREKENILLADGSYVLDMTIDDKITVNTIPAGNHMDPGRGVEVIKTVSNPEGRHIYRVTCTRGIAQLFIDNEFALSMRLPDNMGSAMLKRTGSAEDSFILLKEIEDQWTFSEDFEDTKSTAPQLFWDGDADIKITDGFSGKGLSVTSGKALVNGFMENPVINAKVNVSKKGNGGAWLYVRYISDVAHIAVGYNTDTSAWELVEKYQNTRKVIASSYSKLPDGWFDLQFVVNEDNYALYINGSNMLSAVYDKFRCAGKVGFFSDKKTITIDNFSVKGNGRVTAGVTEIRFPNASPQEFVELSDGRIVCINYNGSANYESLDGINFTKMSTNYFGHNTIRLQNDEILTIKSRITHTDNDGETGLHSEAYISKDDGKTFEGPFVVEKEKGVYKYNFSTENCKLEQASDGRIYFTSSEIYTSGEDVSCEWLMYSDDNGRTWKRSKNPNWSEITGYVGAESKAVELPDGKIRLYTRSNVGFIRYVDLPDKGETIPQDTLVDSQFASPMCAYNITRDSYETNVYYMTWAYDNTNNFKTPLQGPRHRIGLAVSYDGCKSWEYVTDLMSYNLTIDKFMLDQRFANGGIRVFEDYIYVCASMRGVSENAINESQGYVWRIDKDAIRSQKRFPLLFVYETSKSWDPIGYDENRINKAYIQKAECDIALVFGETVSVEKSEQGLVFAETVAKYVGAELEEQGEKIILTVDGKTAEFTKGSNVVLINGKEYLAKKCCIGKNGIPADAVAEAFDKSIYIDENYTVLSNTSEWPSVVLEKANKMLLEAI